MLGGGERRYKSVGCVLGLHDGNSAGIPAHHAYVACANPYYNSVVRDEYYILVVPDGAYAADLALLLVYLVVEYAVSASVLEPVVVKLNAPAVALVGDGKEHGVRLNGLK